MKLFWKEKIGNKENDFYKIKGGIIDGKVMTAEEIVTLAKLPSRDALLSIPNLTSGYSFKTFSNL